MTDNKWTASDIPDMRGKIAIVTGANSGIGVDTTRGLASKGATVIMACRNLQKANPVADEIRRGHPSAQLVVMALDLNDLASVRQFSAEFQARYDRLDLLINNAGIMHPPYGKTAQGFETQFGVNHLGHFALTGLLLSQLNKAPQARVVTVSSMSHRFGEINFDDLNWEKRSYAANAAYGQSKLANLLFTYELQRRLSKAGKGTLAVAAHPGWTGTNLQQHSPMFLFLNRFFAQTPDMGALPTLYAAAAPNVQGGEYFGPNGFMEIRGYPVKVQSNARSNDQAVATKLWAVSETLTGVRFGI